MDKIIVTGNTRGIGLHFYNHFKNQGFNVLGYNRSTGFEAVISESEKCDLFINNAYADGYQNILLDALHDKVKKMIVCGSVAAFYPDPNLIMYSKHKKNLADRVKLLNNPNILMLHLTAKSYNDPNLLIKIIDLWLENPIITEIFFDRSGNPNE